MKKCYANKDLIYIIIFGTVFFVVLAIIGIVLLISGIDEGKTNVIIVYSILSAVLLSFVLLYIFELNRVGSKIIYDSERQIVFRKGFIYGCISQIKVKDIKEIAIVPIPWEATCFVLVDFSRTTIDKKLKKSYITMKKTKESHEFIKCFWDKPLVEYKTYADFFINNCYNVQK